jgi:putative endonuclease
MYKTFMFYYVYFLKSVLYPDKHYIGFTTDIKNRLERHNSKQVVSTKKYAPWRIIYAESYINKKDALGREKFLKSGSGWKYLRKQNIHYFTKNNPTLL